MSAYEPPTQNLAIFDPDVFSQNDEPLTIATGSKYFLKYPSAQGTENLQAINVNGTATFNSAVNVNGALTVTPSSSFKSSISLDNTSSIANRTLNTSYINFYNSAVASPLTINGRLENDNGKMSMINDTNNGTINFTMKDAGGVSFNPFQFLTTGNVCNRALSMGNNNNINFGSGTGIISQTIVSGDVSTQNALRRTSCTITSTNPTGTGTSALDILDTTTSRGLFIVPSADNGSLSDTNVRGDCVIGSRIRNGGAITISNYNDNFRNGLRVFTTDASNCGIKLQCGQNTGGQYTELAMDYNRITNNTITTFNNAINFNPTTPQLTNSSKRLLSGLGTLSFTDISGNNSTNGSIVSRIWTDTSFVNNINGMYYDCGINSGFHQFLVRDSGGVVSTPIYFGSSLTSVSNTFVVRNATTTSNRLDIDGDTTPNTYIRGRTSTFSTDAHIHFRCDFRGASGSVVTNDVLNMTPTFVNYRRPIQFNYLTTPSAINQLGFLVGTQMTSVNVASSTNIRSITSYTFTSAGTYLINWGVYANMSTGTATFTQFQIGIANTATNTFDTYTQTYPSYRNLIRTYPTLTTTSDLYEPTSCVYVAATNSVAYFNYLTNYTGGTNIVMGGYYTITRIG